MSGYWTSFIQVSSVFVSVVLQSCLVTAGGWDGTIQYPGTGEYCQYYHQLREFEINDYTPSSSCRPCWDGPELQCPWNCNVGCSGVDNGYDSAYNVYKSSYTCVEGCMFTDLCFAIDNGYFTGSGATVGDPMSCPFDCNPGYTRVDFSCVLDTVCLAGQYKVNGMCVPCPFCENGYWLDGCTGTNAGVCRECTNLI